MAIYQAKFLTPYNSTIDGTAINPFSFTCQGSTITKYNAKAYRVSDNAQVYTTGDVVLSPVKYNNDIITFDIPASTFTNGVQYKWDVTTYEGASFVASFQVTFWANAEATLTMTIPAIITSQSYTFTATYTQINNVPIQYFYFVLSDFTGELRRTDLVFSGNISHTFDGFVDGNSYDIQVFGLTSNGAVVSSILYSFGVSYSKPSVLIRPSLSQDCKNSLVSIVWDYIVQINGTSSGSKSYVDGLARDGGKALSLATGATAEWTFDIPIDFTANFMIQVPALANGNLIQLKDDYYFGYDSSVTAFYIDVNGTKVYSLPYEAGGKVFFISLRPNNMKIKEFEYYWTWEDYRYTSVFDMNQLTVYEVLNKF